MLYETNFSFPDRHFIFFLLVPIFHAFRRPGSKNEENDFIVENDTLKVTYRFSGDHGPVKITIYNKTNEPLEIDWAKSALIMNDRAYRYCSPDLLLNGPVQNDSVKSLFNNGYVNANIYVNETSQFIPPHSFISKVPLSLPVHSIVFPEGKLKKEIYRTAKNYSVRYKKIEYTSEKTPISFRSYLSFNYGGNERRGFSKDSRFYVSEVWQTGSGPDHFPQELMEKGNICYVTSD